MCVIRIAPSVAKCVLNAIKRCWTPLTLTLRAIDKRTDEWLTCTMSQLHCSFNIDDSMSCAQRQRPSGCFLGSGTVVTPCILAIKHADETFSVAGAEGGTTVRTFSFAAMASHTPRGVQRRWWRQPAFNTHLATHGAVRIRPTHRPWPSG